MTTSFHNKTIVVTGATSGIGLAAAEELIRQGANIIGVGRSETRCRTAEQRLRSLSHGGSVTYLVADLTRIEQVRRLGADIRALLERSGRPVLDGLVNNAGMFTYWLALTPEGIETQWAINHLAPFLLTDELLPLLEAAPAGRIVTTSSGSHYHTHLRWDDLQLRHHYNGLLAYKQCKLANVLFTAELNRRLSTGSRVRAFAADPGLVKTEIGLKGTPGIVQWVWQRRSSGGIPPAEAAHGIVLLLDEAHTRGKQEIYWKHGVPQQPSREGLDPAAAQRLWAISAQMCGVA